MSVLCGMTPQKVVRFVVTTRRTSSVSKLLEPALMSTEFLAVNKLGGSQSNVLMLHCGGMHN
jgi:hypothetical protein